MSRHERMWANRLRWSAVGGAVGAAMPVAVPAQARAYEWGWGIHPMWGVWGAGMMLMMLVFWGVVIVGIALGIRWLADLLLDEAEQAMAVAPVGGFPQQGLQMFPDDGVEDRVLGVAWLIRAMGMVHALG